MPLYYSVVNGGFYNPPQTLFVGSNPYGGNTIYGNAYGDQIYGESQYSLYSGTIGNNTIYGGGGNNDICGDAHALYGTVIAHSNTIWADNPYMNDPNAFNRIDGNAVLMGGDSSSGTADLHGNVFGNTIYDSFGYTSLICGNANEMTDHAWGGHNRITAYSAYSYVYGDALQIIGSTSSDAAHGSGVQAGGNWIDFFSPKGFACGDADVIEGTFSGGHNNILIGAGTQQEAFYGTAQEISTDVAGGTITCGFNWIEFGDGNHTIYGDVYSNPAGSNVFGGHNVVYGDGNSTIYGECQSNYGLFYGGHNTLYGSHSGGNTTIYGDCISNTGTFHGGYNTFYGDGLGVGGNCVIYGDCVSNTGTFSGGHNTIYAQSANATMYGSATDGYNHFVFTPGTGLDQIGSRNGDGSVFQGFDQEGGAAFNHAHADVIDVSAYHLVGGFQNLVVGASPSGDAVIYLPPAGYSHAGQITLVGIHPQDLVAGDFLF
jgi:hypothetical protein